MSSIIMQVVIALNLLLGHHNQQANQVHVNGTYTQSQQGIVIIDSDELARKH